MKVSAKQGETMGSHHHCAYNFHSRQCECRCWGAKFEAIFEDVAQTTAAPVEEAVSDWTPQTVDLKAFHQVPVIVGNDLPSLAAEEAAV